MQYVEFDLDKALAVAGVDKQKIELLAGNRCFDGLHLRFKHQAATLNCEMIVGVYLPPSVLIEGSEKAPALYWLSGLTCSDQNFLTKAGALQKASELGLVLICPDTSPRGDAVPDDDSYDLGQGAGFYVDATEPPWSENFKMYSYITKELIAWCEEHLPIRGARSISGHSMGGHGALTIAFKNPGMFRSVSAFSPICNPSQVPWGHKAFNAYLGSDMSDWLQHDATELLKTLDERLPLLIDQGTQDQFLQEQLSTQTFAAICQQNQHPLTLNMHDGYDHSYFFVSSFINQHLVFHGKALGLAF